MSLIYDALRQSAPDGAGTAVPASSPRHAPSGWWRRPLPWLVAGVLVAGPLGFLLARQTTPVQTPTAPPVGAGLAGDRGGQPDPATLSTPAATTALALTTDPAPTAAVAASAIAPPAATATPPPAAVATAPPPASTANRDIQVVASKIEVSVRDTSTPQRGGVDAVDADAAKVREAMGALHAAVGDADAAATGAAIARLETLLPPQSLTLLRARAWAAHGHSDLAEARRLYRAILDRVPDDEHASINLALLDARNGDVGEARARLDRLAARSSRSPHVLRALAELEAARR